MLSKIIGPLRHRHHPSDLSQGYSHGLSGPSCILATRMHPQPLVTLKVKRVKVLLVIIQVCIRLRIILGKPTLMMLSAAPIEQ